MRLLKNPKLYLQARLCRVPLKAIFKPIPCKRQFHSKYQQLNKKQSPTFDQQSIWPWLLKKFKYYWATDVGKIIIALLLAVIGRLFFIIWSGVYFVYLFLTRVSRTSKTFEEVSEREQDSAIEEGTYISRPAIEKDLLNLLETTQSNYLLVYGEQCVGKSTLVKQAIKQARQQGTPVFYFSVENRFFLQNFSVALKGFDVVPEYSSEPSLFLTELLGCGRETPKSVPDMLPHLEKAGKLLKEKTKRRPVLVIDTCDNLETQHLMHLQDFAKEQADKREMLVVFVSSEGKAPHTLFTRSAASRMRRYRIGELSREDADKYLQTRGINDVDDRSKILDITGYTFQYLSGANGSNIKSTNSMVSSFIIRYLNALDASPLEEKFNKVVTTILDNGFITMNDFNSTIGDVDRGKQLLSGNIFTVHENETSSTVSFQNTATHNFFKRQLRQN